MRYAGRNGLLVLAFGALALAAACGGGGGPGSGDLPQLGQAQSAPLIGSCADLATKITYANPATTAASAVAGGTAVGGVAARRPCAVRVEEYEDGVPVDGQAYAIGFEMR